MGKKENRPDACTASGTASTICDYDSTSVFAGQDILAIDDNDDIQALPGASKLLDS